MGVTYTILDKANDTAELERILASTKTDIVFTESPTNPLLQCVDVPTVAEVIRMGIGSDRH